MTSAKVRVLGHSRALSFRALASLASLMSCGGHVDSSRPKEPAAAAGAENTHDGGEPSVVVGGKAATGGSGAGARGPELAGEAPGGAGSLPEATCTDAIRNGDETDVDCGGSCAPCHEAPCEDVYLLPTPELVLEKDALVGWYRFRDSHSLGLDMSSAGNDAVHDEGVTQGGDQHLGCVAVFEGHGIIDFPASVGTSLTFSLWLRTSTSGLGAAKDPWFVGSNLLDADQPGVVEDFGLTLLGNRLAFGVGKPDVTVRGGPPLDDDVWHHLVATRDDATGEVALFVDGDEQVRTSAPAGARSLDRHLSMGRNQLVGHVADVRIYNRAFTSAEVVQLHQGK
jgi:hypothetical protein